MKHTLKNFPTIFKNFKEHSHDCIVWKIEFEKEVKEWLDCLAEFENHYDAGRKAVLKEILGDSE